MRSSSPSARSGSCSAWASERVTVRIEDDGAGFPAEVLELVGEPYLSTRNEAGGLGSASSSPRRCLREPARRCNLPIVDARRAGAIRLAIAPTLEETRPEM